MYLLREKVSIYRVLVYQSRNVHKYIGSIIVPRKLIQNVYITTKSIHLSRLLIYLVLVYRGRNVHKFIGISIIRRKLIIQCTYYAILVLLYRGLGKIKIVSVIWITENILSASGTNDDLGPHRSDSDLNARVTIFS